MTYFAIIMHMDLRSLEHLCGLARIELSADEVKEFEGKFKRLIGFVDLLRAYEPRGDEDALAMSGSLLLREDTEQAFSWPEGTRHNYRVPQIIDFEGE
jgi:Asp-tRNA(Asn)/Glu-tRNA(Gln) amidotransferase C subunit